MTSLTEGPAIDTYFAPAARATDEELSVARNQVLQNELAMTLLEAIPDLALVLNSRRQIVAANRRAAESLGAASAEDVLGLRPGEFVACVNAGRAPGGCGTGKACQVCGAVHAVLECLESGRPTGGECRIRTTLDADGGALDLYVSAVPLPLRDLDLVVLSLRDVSADKRRSVLERVFLHDVLNIATGLKAVAEILTYADDDPETEEECKRDLRRMSEQLHEEITVQRQLLAAEQGKLELDLAVVAVPDVLNGVAELYRHHIVARDRILEVGDTPDSQIETDPTLLRRILGNLVKNALEATPRGGTVTLDAEDGPAHVGFRVTNPGVIPDDIQKQIFQRSFSTKEGAGRGIGTHSVKLLTERYLQGEVEFTSRVPEGTVFTVTLPKRALTDDRQNPTEGRRPGGPQGDRHEVMT